MVTLQPQQAEILHILVKRSPKVVSHDSLIAALYGNAEDVPTFASLKVAICRLRKRVAALPFEIKTAWGKGWLLELKP